jgi:hypothetical protein
MRFIAIANAFCFLLSTRKNIFLASRHFVIQFEYFSTFFSFHH